MSLLDVPEQPAKGEALLSRQDLEALDLKAGDKVTLAACDSAAKRTHVTVRPLSSCRDGLCCCRPATWNPSAHGRPHGQGRAERCAPVASKRARYADSANARARRGRIPLVLSGRQPAMVADAPLAGERPHDPEGVSSQTKERLLLLHDLCRDRRLRPQHDAGRPARNVPC